MAAAGMGMHRHSVARDESELGNRLVESLALGGATRGTLIELFIDGREFTVLVVCQALNACGLEAYPAVEMCYQPATPAEERILFHGHRDTSSPHAPVRSHGQTNPHCVYNIAPPELQERLRDTAARAFTAVGGIGYGRVDMRMDSAGRIYVLEVNANCSLSREEPTIAHALAQHGQDIVGLIAMILAEAESHHA